MGVSALIFLIRAIIFGIALPIISNDAQAKNNLPLATEIAINIMQFVEGNNLNSKPNHRTLCILQNKTTTDDEFNIGKLKVISITDHLVVNNKCDAVLVEKEFNYLIPAISLLDNSKNILIIGTLNNSISNGAHLSLIREGDTYKIHGNTKKIQSSRFVIGSKLLRLVKMD